MERLISCENKEDFWKTYEVLSSTWSELFKSYFDDQLKCDLLNHACRFVTMRFSAFEHKVVTNNISESMNNIIKSVIEYKELPIDAMILALKQLHDWYAYEFERGKANFGEFRLKSTFSNLHKHRTEIDLPQITSKDKILQDLLSNDVYVLKGVEKGPQYRLTQTSIARQCVKKGLIGFNSATSSFSVASPFNEHVHSVKVFPMPSKCSCTSTGNCYHILTVHMSLKLEESQIQDSRHYSLSLMKRKHRGKERKSGRKRPRPHDYDYQVKPAPDAESPRSRAELVTSTPKSKLKIKDVSTTKPVSYERNASANFERNNSKVVQNDVIRTSAKSAKSDDICNLLGSKTTTDVVNVPESAKENDLPCLKPKKAFSDGLCNSLGSKTTADNVKLHESAYEDHLPSLKPKKVFLGRFNASRLNVNIVGGKNSNVKPSLATGITVSDNSLVSLKVGTAFSNTKSAINSEISDYPWLEYENKITQQAITRHCLMNTNWLDGETIENAIKSIINYNTNGYESFLQCDPFLLTFARIDASDTIAKFLHNNEALNRDYLLVVVHTGNHWYLIIVDFLRQLVVSIDSLPSVEDQLTLDFAATFNIIQTCYAIANMSTNLSSWKFFSCTDIPKQKNWYDCGVHVIALFINLNWLQISHLFPQEDGYNL